MKNRFSKHKLDVQWIGPFIVLKHKGRGSYAIQGFENGKIYNVNRVDLKPWNGELDVDISPILNNEDVLKREGVLSEDSLVIKIPVKH